MKPKRTTVGAGTPEELEAVLRSRPAIMERPSTTTMAGTDIVLEVAARIVPRWKDQDDNYLHNEDVELLRQVETR